MALTDGSLQGYQQQPASGAPSPGMVWNGSTGQWVSPQQESDYTRLLATANGATSSTVGTGDTGFWGTGVGNGFLGNLGNSSLASGARELLGGFGTVPGVTDASDAQIHLDPTQGGSDAAAWASEKNTIAQGAAAGFASPFLHGVGAGLGGPLGYWGASKANDAIVGWGKSQVAGINAGDQWQNGGPPPPGMKIGPDGKSLVPISGGAGGGGMGTGTNGAPLSTGGGDPNSLNGIAQQAFAYGGQNRDWLMNQNAQAQGYYGGAHTQYGQMFGPGGSMAGPGAGEQAFGQTGGSILNQTPIQGYQQQTAGQLGQAGAGENAYGYMMQNGLGGPGQYEQQAGGYQNALAQPGAMQQYQQQTAGQMQTPGSFEQQAGGYQQALGRPGDANSYYGQVGGSLQRGGNAQSAYSQMAGGYQAPTALESAYGGLMRGYGQQGMQQQTAPGMANSLQGGQVQSLYGQQMGQLNQPGQLEKFAAKDAAGNNPYFDQLRQTTNAGLDQEFNAGGNFNSGARMAALAKADSNLAAQQYQQEGQLQGQAQQATQQRLGQQQGLAGAASGEQLGRTQAASGLLGNADQQQLQRLGGQAGLAGDVSGQSLNYLNSGINAAQGTDASNLGRLSLGGQLAQNSQQDAYQQLMGGASIGQNAQSAQLARLMGGGQLAQNAQQDAYQQLMGGAGISQGAQAAQMGRLGMVGQYGNDAQSQMLARLGLGGQLANQSTAAGFQQYNDYLNQAQNAQAASQGRQQLGYADAFGMGNAQAGLQQGFATNASDAYAQMVQAGLGANVNALGLSMQQQQANADRQLAYLGLGLKGATSLPGLLGGGGGGGYSLPGGGGGGPTDSGGYTGVDYGPGSGAYTPLSGSSLDNLSGTGNDIFGIGTG